MMLVAPEFFRKIKPKQNQQTKNVYHDILTLEACDSKSENQLTGFVHIM